MPTKHIPTGTEADVCADISLRQQIGINKYGTTVAENPLPLVKWLQHAYEECLDQAVYLKRAINILQQDKNKNYYALADVQRRWAETDAMDNNNENG